ncbi:MAG: hypothetical protein KBT46_07150 [Ruminococcus sp.]|nr:hypothetical protein [Candidatus Copronaster equi]
MKKAKENGTDKYISPDLQVDCSTAFLPDYTWCIKDCTHMNMPDCIHEMFAEIFSADGYYTVFDNEKYPQYLLYDKESDTISPLTSENGDNNEEWRQKSFLQRMFAILKTAFKKLGTLIQNLFK